MLKITENDYNELMDIFDGYVYKLDEFKNNSEEYNKLKTQLDNKFCGVNMIFEHEIVYNEFNIGNTIIDDDILTCIYNNSIHKYKMIHRKAKKEELAYITKADKTCPFNERYIGRCFYVSESSNRCEGIKDHVIIYEEGFNTGWCLYDD